MDIQPSEISAILKREIRNFDAEAEVTDQLGRQVRSAVELLVEHAAARVLTDVVDAYPAAIAAPRVTVRTARVNHVLGTSISTEQVTALLSHIVRAAGLGVVTGGPDVRPPLPPEFTSLPRVVVRHPIRLRRKPRQSRRSRQDITALKGCYVAGLLVRSITFNDCSGLPIGPC